MTNTTIDHVEVSSSLPASKFFKAFCDFDNIAPKAEPQTIKSVTVLEGDGGVGTVKTIIYGDGAAPITNAKLKVDSIDPINLSLGYTFFEGDALMDIIETATHHFTFTPSLDGGSVCKQSFVFKFKGDSKFTREEVEIAKETFKKSIKAIESYAIAHVEAY